MRKPAINGAPKSVYKNKEEKVAEAKPWCASKQPVKTDGNKI